MASHLDVALARHVLCASYDVVLFADEGGRVAAVEGDPAPLLGRTAGQLAGVAATDVFPGGLPEIGAAAHWRVLHASGALVPVQALAIVLPGEPQQLVVGLRASPAIARLALAYGYALRAQRVLHAVHRALTSADDEGAILGEVCRVLVGECGHPLVWVGFAEHDAERTVRRVASAGLVTAFDGLPPASWADGERGQGLAGTAVRTGRTCVVRRTLDDPGAAPWLPVLRAIAVGSGIGLPLRVGGVVIGVLSLHARERDAFSPPEVELLEEVADAVGRACALLRATAARRDAAEALRALNAELERRVAERTTALHDLYDNAPCGYHTAGPDGVTIGINATLLRWLDRSGDELLGRRPSEFLTPESAAAVRADFVRLAASPDADHWGAVERELVRRDGSTFWTLVSGATSRDAEGRPIEFRANLIDISERKRADARLREQEALLQRALDEAQQAARAKDDFLASMSHELRTPLNGILGVGEALLEDIYGPLAPAQRNAVIRVRESGGHLLALINDILDVAKVEAGKLTLELAAVELDDLVRESLHLVQESARRKGLDVDLALSLLDGRLLLDARRMKQVLVNLLSNAVKFTPEGGRIGIQVREGRDTIAVTVWDHGIGIAPSDLPRLFQPFVQLDSRLSRAHAGTGLGLTLVRRLVELHGGEVRVESQPGRGSRFTVELPARRPGSDPSPTPRRSPSRPLPITPRMEAGPLVLIAEDEELNADLLHDVLSAVGYRVQRAQDGREAVEMARALRPAAIIMDVQMPAMDGLSAIRVLRADDDPALRAVPIVALTALTMAGDEQRCLSAGASAYLSKPLSYKRLLLTLEAWLRGDAGS